MNDAVLTWLDHEVNPYMPLLTFLTLVIILFVFVTTGSA